jgi:Flp pilus assembly protein TadG
MTGFRDRRSLKKGGAAVELVVVFPVVLLLLVGVIDYGRVFYTSVTVANAARAGADWGQFEVGHQIATDTIKARAQLDGNDAGTLTLAARRFCECGIGGANASCSICAGGAAPDVYVEVTATKSVSMFLPYPGLPNTISVSRTATFRSQ